MWWIREKRETSMLDRKLCTITYHIYLNIIQEFLFQINHLQWAGIRGGYRTFVYRNLNVFCVGIYLKIEDFEGGGVSYIQVNLVILGIKVLVEWCSFPTADGIP